MDFTGTFDSLMVDFTTTKQKAVLTLNEDARRTFENLKEKDKLSIVIKEYRMKREWRACRELVEITVGSMTGIQLQCYYGSHTYNTKEMSRLIDGVVTRCKELDIETLPPDELKRMKGQIDRVPLSCWYSNYHHTTVKSP